jgi:hypothetical protein
MVITARNFGDHASYLRHPYIDFGYRYLEMVTWKLYIRTDPY